MTKGYTEISTTTWARTRALLIVCAREMPCVSAEIEGSGKNFCLKTLGHDVDCACRRHWAIDILLTMAGAGDEVADQWLVEQGHKEEVKGET